VEFESAELIPFTDFRRDLTDVMEKLQEGTIEKAVVTKHGKVKCVLLSVKQYEQLKG
jgi:prevent-host-death family protein